jgi:MFS family permease
MNGISLSQMGQNLFRLAGPAAAGYLIDNYNFASVYFLMTGMYVIATISTAFLPRTTKNIVRGGNAMKDVVGGLQYLKGDVIILMVVVFGVCHVVSGQPFSQMLPVFTESILNVSASKLGFLSVVSAAGALVTSLILASLPNKKRGVILIFSGAVMSIPIMIFCIYPQWSTAIIAMVFFGIGPTIHGAMTSTVVQSYVKPEYRSRMQSLVTMSMALASLGTFFAGILSDAVGVQWAVGSMALFLTLVSFGCYIFLPRFRKLN